MVYIILGAYRGWKTRTSGLRGSLALLARLGRLVARGGLLLRPSANAIQCDGCARVVFAPWAEPFAIRDGVQGRVQTPEVVRVVALR